MTLAPGWARPAITPRPSGPIRAMSKLGMATVGRGTEGGAAVCGVAASTGGDGAGATDEVAAALAAWPRMAGSPRQASPRTAAVTTAPAAISQRTVRGITLLMVRDYPLRKIPFLGCSRRRIGRRNLVRDRGSPTSQLPPVLTPRPG